MGRKSSGNHIYPGYKDMLIGGRKLYNYCLKHPASKFNSVSNINPPETVTNAFAPEGPEGLNADDGSTISLDTLKTLSKGSREVLSHLLEGFSGPSELKQKDLAESLGYKTTQPVRALLKELESSGLIRTLPGYTGTKFDFKVDYQTLSKHLKENQRELSLSNTGTKILDLIRAQGDKTLTSTNKDIRKEINCSSPNEISRAVKELQESGLVKRDTSSKKTVLILEDN
ncbi:MAG: hypothetical protein KF802_02285 [Bdellovibrionaceae bacterium]|nr:hypothetical protein [Pseudobdellovibrionaceae bacterium]